LLAALYTKATLAAAEALNVEVDSSSSWIMLLTESTSFDRVHMPAAEQDWSTAQRTTYLTVLLVCVADGSLCIERFGDDVSRSRLSTVLVQKSPVELVLPGSCFSLPNLAGALDFFTVFHLFQIDCLLKRATLLLHGFDYKMPIRLNRP
jgi:hypothetical protein